MASWISVVENSNYVMEVEDLVSGATGTVIITGVVAPAISEKMTLVSTAVISADKDAFNGNNQAEVTLVVQPTQFEVYLPIVIR